MKMLVVAVVTLALGTPLAAQWLTHKTPGIPRTPDGKANLTAAAPRTPDGKPDFSGLWTKFSPKYARNAAADLLDSWCKVAEFQINNSARLRYQPYEGAAGPALLRTPLDPHGSDLQPALDARKYDAHGPQRLRLSALTRPLLKYGTRPVSGR